LTTELNKDTFTADFGDNKFPYYQGNTSVRLEERQQDEDDEKEEKEAFLIMWTTMH
jgi:hypothetical protein